MTQNCLLVATILLSVLANRSLAQSVQPAKVDLIATAKGSKVFLIEAGEVTVGGNLIQRVELGKSSAVITYFNKTAKALQPKYRFRLIDAYGIEVSSFDDKWVLDTVGPGEAKKENKSFYTNNAKDILQFSTITLPADWATPIYLLIEGIDP